ncbi:MAG: 30S ribosomal protein S17 [Gammaproteobacteria bacterium]|nr:30S ribosomal protein S17 [Gammaproteobacteria bacterium]
MSEQAGKHTQEQKVLRTVTGEVISSKMDKTASVSIPRVVKHPLYGKYIRRTTKVLVHDEDNACKEGDVVSITECRPFSKRKAWRVVEILERADAQ